MIGLKKDYSFLLLNRLQVIGLHVALLLLKIWWLNSWTLELHYEEAQYWLWSTRLDWSYYSKPGMVAWLNYCSTSLFGHTYFAIKFPALIAGFIVSLALYDIANDFFNDLRIATLSSVMVYFMPFYYSVSLFHSTDSFLIAFGLLSFYWFQKALSSSQFKYWAFVGLFLGLALLTKYSAVIIGISYFVYCLMYERKQLKNIVLSGVVASLFLLPILIWNYNNDFVTFKHVFHYTSPTDKSPVKWLEVLAALGEFIGGQFAMVSPFLVWILFTRFIRKQKQFRLFYFPAFFSFLFFLVVLFKKGKAPNVNWPFFMYSTLSIIFAYWLIAKQKLTLLIPIAIVQIFAFTIISDTRIIDRTPLKEILPPENDFTDTYHKWKDLADSVSLIHKKHPQALILTDDYKIASMLQFYFGLNTKVEYLGTGSRANQFTYWNDIEKLNAVDKEFIYIAGNKKLKPAIKEQFTTQIYLTQIDSKWRGVPQSDHFVYLLKDAQQLKSLNNGF